MAEHDATAKIAVWWDMKDCPIPEGYDAGRIRQSLEGAFKEKGYSGPVSITAYGDQTKTPRHILKGLFSAGVCVAHTRSESTNYVMYRDMVEWRGQNPPPASMMIISNQVVDKFSWDLVRLQQRKLYNLFLAYSIRPQVVIVLTTIEEWGWEELLQTNQSAPLVVDGGKFYCKSCNFDCQRYKRFMKHLSSYKHAREEYVNPTYHTVRRYTEDWGRNYKATPEFATAKIQVWWDMLTCPIPEGYDARQVRPSIEAAFKQLGYTGPVSITAYGDHKHTPIQALSSTRVHVAHIVTGVEYKRMGRHVSEWHAANPPQTAAIMMVISDRVDVMSNLLVHLLQENNYNLFLAYSFRPFKMSFLLTSAEWLWESLLAGPPLTNHSSLLHKCSESESSESTAMFSCKLCNFDTNSIDNFSAHLLSDEEHAQEEKYIPESRESYKENQRLFLLAEYNHYYWPEVKNERLSRVAEYENQRRLSRLRVAEYENKRQLSRDRRSQFVKKTIRTGSGLLDNQSRLTNLP